MPTIATAGLRDSRFAAASSRHDWSTAQAAPHARKAVPSARAGIGLCAHQHATVTTRRVHWLLATAHAAGSHAKTSTRVASR
ncbi:hypothetical protein FHY30_003311 [Xanthomonas arboricola]|nr:hypothetical protein [Xanthomonas campestris]